MLWEQIFGSSGFIQQKNKSLWVCESVRSVHCSIVNCVLCREMAESIVGRMTEANELK